MILAIITPYYFPSDRGNSVTVQRIASGLRDQGLTVHGFHVTATGPLVVQASRDRSIPTVVTLTRTDMNHDLFVPALGYAMGQRVRQKIETHFPPEGEIGGYLALDRSLAPGKGV